jgi:hypothetical protein
MTRVCLTCMGALLVQGLGPLEVILEKVGASLMVMGDWTKVAGNALGGFLSRLGDRLLGTPR